MRRVLRMPRPVPLEVLPGPEEEVRLLLIGLLMMCAAYRILVLRVNWMVTHQEGRKK